MDATGWGRDWSLVAFNVYMPVLGPSPGKVPIDSSGLPMALTPPPCHCPLPPPPSPPSPSPDPEAGPARARRGGRARALRGRLLHHLGAGLLDRLGAHRGAGDDAAPAAQRARGHGGADRRPGGGRRPGLRCRTRPAGPVGLSESRLSGPAGPAAGPRVLRPGPPEAAQPGAETFGSTRPAGGAQLRRSGRIRPGAWPARPSRSPVPTLPVRRPE